MSKTRKEVIKQYRSTPNGKIRTWESNIRYYKRKVKQLKKEMLQSKNE